MVNEILIVFFIFFKRAVRDPVVWSFIAVALWSKHRKGTLGEGGST